jgi:hypothetical protein
MRWRSYQTGDHRSIGEVIFGSGTAGLGAALLHARLGLLYKPSHDRNSVPRFVCWEKVQRGESRFDIEGCARATLDLFVSPPKRRHSVLQPHRAFAAEL